MIIARMRTDLSHAKEKILEPFYPQDESALLWNLMFKHMQDQNDEMSNHARLCYKDPSCPDNPKIFSKIAATQKCALLLRNRSRMVQKFLIHQKMRRHVSQTYFY